MCANFKREFAAGELKCANCGDPLPAILTNIKPAYACEKPECRTAVYAAGRNLRDRHIEDGQIHCMREGCTNTVPAGDYARRRKLFFCGSVCESFFYNHKSKKVPGLCLHCAKEFVGRTAQLCCSREHSEEWIREQNLLEAGVFADPLRHYLTTWARGHYTPRSLYSIRGKLTNFAIFLCENGIDDFANVTPQVITDFKLNEVDRGVLTNNTIAAISVFYDWRRGTGLHKGDNPVIPKFHSDPARDTPPRPFSEADMTTLWNVLVEHGTALERLAFAIGEECGLRVNEVANVRLSDIDHDAQRITVRLPNKGKSERRPFYHEKVKQCLADWLAIRTPKIPHDHLLHNVLGRPIFHRGWIQIRIRDLVCQHSKFTSFSFHRLRHTWATRLANAGMDPAAIMELGGWKSWSAMKHYIELCQKHIEDSYHTAMEKDRADRMSANESVDSLEALAFAQTAGPQVSGIQ